MSSKEEKKEITASVLEYLARVPDPRVEPTRAHPQVNILVMALLAVLCGADSFAAIEEFGRCKKEFLARFLDLADGIPSHDTFGRVFAALIPETLQEVFRQWIGALAEVTKGEVVAIDGRTLRRCRVGQRLPASGPMRIVLRPRVVCRHAHHRPAAVCNGGQPAG